MIEALLACDSLGNVYLKQILAAKSGTRAKPPDLTMGENIMRVVARVDSAAIYIAYKERFHESVMHNETGEKTTIEVNRLTQWQKIRLRFADITFIITLLVITIKFKNIWKNSYQRILKWLTKS